MQRRPSDDRQDWKSRFIWWAVSIPIAAYLATLDGALGVVGWLLFVVIVFEVLLEQEG